MCPRLRTALISTTLGAGDVSAQGSHEASPITPRRRRGFEGRFDSRAGLIRFGVRQQMTGERKRRAE